MRMKKYQASTMAAALDAIRQELGPRAVILHSSTTRRGLLGKSGVEVVAAVDTLVERPSRTSPVRVAEPRRSRSEGAVPSRFPGDASPGRPARPAPSAALRAAPSTVVAGPGASPMELVRAIANGSHPVEPAALREMQQHVKELRGAIGQLVQSSQWPGLAKLAPPLADLFKRLIEQEIEPALAQELVTTIDSELSLRASHDRTTVLECLGKHLRRMLPTTGPLRPTPGQPTVLFLVGPTGVGKTTTIAKLAATLAMQRHSVALITCDTYRIAAIPQLKTYADILRTPFEVAYTPDELTAKVMEHVERDFIIVDTPGRSQRNADQLAELRQFVMAVPCRTAYLTVAAGTRYRDMLDVVARFGAIPFDGLLVTKLDETTTCGPVLNLVWQTGKPVTYLTNGQNVPHDIDLATSQGLSSMLIDSAYGGAARADAPALAGSVA